MKRRVAFFEFSIYDQLPLVSGYLQAYAQADPVVAEAFAFVYCSKQVERISYEEALSAVRALDARVVCFSCYVWNMGLIKRLVRDLRNDSRIERIILGGHQISHYIREYVDPADSKIVVINGQGEIPFREILRRLTDSRTLFGLRGVSAYVDGQLWNGGEAAVVENLDEIPSPFLGGLFDGMTHPITVFETNRGCPYKCSFCTWGGDTMRVTKFSTERIKEELLWIVKKPIYFIYLADANWGMLPRDIELSDYIAQLKRTHGFPLMVYYAAAKNKPKGSVACIEKFHEGGVITSQALGIQSLNDDTLAKIDRKNIRNDAYIQMFGHLKARQIDSYCELIWPLPGETLETLKAGFGQLIDLGAPTTIMYPSLLINNARLTTQTIEYDMEAEATSDWKSELRIVKKTRDADRASVKEGFWFFYAHFLLANTDLHKGLLHYVSAASGRRHVDIVSDFAHYLRASTDKSAYSGLIQSIFDDDAHGSLMTIGRLAAHVTHEERLAAQRDVASFVMQQVPGNTLRNLAAVCVWVYSLPKLFTNTPGDETKLLEMLGELATASGESFSKVATAVRVNGNRIELDVDDSTGVWREVLPHFHANPPARPDAHQYRLTIEKPGAALGYNSVDLNRNQVYAHGMILRLRHISARLSAA